MSVKIQNFKLHLLFILFLSIAIGVQGQTKQEGIDKNFFPFSVWYSGGKARAPMLSEITTKSEQEWRTDLRQIKDLGFNTVRTWVEWAACEPEPGKYNFANLHLLMRLANEVGLKVFIQIYVDSAPDWVAQNYPYALFEAQSGDKVHPQSAPGACTDNKAVEDAVLNFYSETAKVATSYPNFFGWDLWSEPHIINWASLNYIPNVQFCFCDGTQARFRKWLEKKYSSLENLNRAWYRNFTDWPQVEAPRFSTILSYTDFIDWKTFIYEKLVQDMQARYDAIRKVDKTHLITAHAVGASLFQSPHVGAGATDDFLMAGPLDYYGVSLYPKHNHPQNAWSVTTLRTVMDFTRSANREKGGWYVGELQAGLGTIALQVSDPVTSGDHRIWAWSAIAKGAKGVNIYAYYPMSSGYEAGGYGLINLDGTLTERAIKAGEIAEVVNRNQQLFLGATPAKAEIGIVYNPLTQMVGGMQRNDFPAALSQSLIGYFQTFANHNIPVDFIHRKHIENRDLSQYKLIIIPYPIMFTREAASGLRAFVENGGYVLAEARIGWNDDRGYASEIIPGLGMHDIFGVRENEIRMRDNIELTISDENHPALQGLEEGSKLKGSLYLQSLSILQNKNVNILAIDEKGQPVVVSTQFGKGESMLVGSYLGMANFKEVSPENDRFFVNLLKWAKIKRPFTTSLDGRTSNQVEVRLQDTKDGPLLFIINHSAGSEEIDIVLYMDSDGVYTLRDVINETQKEVRSSGNTLNINTRIDSKDVHVIGITASNQISNKKR
ncbi:MULTISPECIES: beta-galactosidase [Proteiniphilum]|jgi:beta-galactosidase|uniref:beta-galactosidase n=1 Tax=Proteiniphilum TaxID=294702 RepID=UPI001EECA588|nr:MULTISPECIES: beta-galactosidase [Proteiniphilum]ULB35099.1 beta-galactosidase [Proteiniphilum propionicum]